MRAAALMRGIDVFVWQRNGGTIASGVGSLLTPAVHGGRYGRKSLASKPCFLSSLCNPWRDISACRAD